MDGAVLCFFSCKNLLGEPLQLEHSWNVARPNALTYHVVHATSRQPPRAADSLLFLLDLCRPFATASEALLTRGPSVVQYDSLRTIPSGSGYVFLRLGSLTTIRLSDDHLCRHRPLS